jgi:hypothetical protein
VEARYDRGEGVILYNGVRSIVVETYFRQWKVFRSESSEYVTCLADQW